MNRTKVTVLTFLCVVGCGLIVLKQSVVLASSTVQGDSAAKASADMAKDGSIVNPQSLSASRAAREEKTLQDARRQQLAEKEAALSAKEQELKKLGARLEAQAKAMEESKKRLDDSLKQKKKTLDEKRKRMLTLLKKMRPEQAGQFLGKMEEGSVVAILNDLDNKMILKLMPYLNQPMVLKWIKENLNNS